MRSTNVPSNKYVVGGDTKFTGEEKEPVEMRQYNEKGEPLAGKGPTRIEVIQGPNAVMQVQDNIVVKEGKKVVGRATKEGKVLSGDSKKVNQALKEDKDIGR